MIVPSDRANQLCSTLYQELCRLYSEIQKRTKESEAGRQYYQFSKACIRMLVEKAMLTPEIVSAVSSMIDLFIPYQETAYAYMRSGTVKKIKSQR